MGRPLQAVCRQPGSLRAPRHGQRDRYSSAALSCFGDSEIAYTPAHGGDSLRALSPDDGTEGTELLQALYKQNYWTTRARESRRGALAGQSKLSRLSFDRTWLMKAIMLEVRISAGVQKNVR
jgi:hypothetical protein